MSFQYAQYGEGYDVLLPTPAALRFNEALQLRGQEVSILYQELAGRDSYGNPVYSEKETIEKAMVKARKHDTILPPGEVKETRTTVLFKQWASVAEGNYELEIGGNRYYIELVHRTEACLEVEARRMIE